MTRRNLHDQMAAHDSRRLIVIFGVSSLAAVAAGCVAMAASGIAPASWLRTPVAWAVGAGLAALLARCAEPRNASTGIVVMGTGALIATLFAAGVEGVHRWLDLGPLHINIAAICLPAVIVSLAAIRAPRHTRLVVTIITATVLLLQPDASQLTAFAIAASTLAVRSTLGTGRKAFAVLVAVVFTIGVWMRPDPLEPVAEVEQVFALCAAVSPFLAFIAGLALAAATVAPLVLSSNRCHPARDGAIALSAYFLAVSIAPFFGWFPVPLVALGMSTPIGWWLGIGLLLVMARDRRDL